MDKVLRREIYMPEMHELSPIRLGSPPPKKELKAELIRVMSNLNPTEPGLALIQEIQRKDCDVQWMTSMLFMLDKDHLFFNEHYSGRGRYRANHA